MLFFTSMTLTLTFPPEVEAKLRNRAAANGQPPDVYACSILTEALAAPEPLPGPQTPAATGDPEDDHRLRGVIAIEQPRDSIFVRPMNCRVEDLPKWSPQIVLPRRTLAEDDDA